MKKNEQQSSNNSYQEVQQLILDGKVDFVKGARMLFAFGYSLLESGEFSKADRSLAATTSFIDEVRQASGVPSHTDFARAAFHHGAVMLEAASFRLPHTEGILQHALKAFEESAAILEIRIQESVTLNIPHALGTALFFRGITQLRLNELYGGISVGNPTDRAADDFFRAAELWKQVARSGFHAEQAVQGALTAITALTLAQESLLSGISGSTVQGS